MSGHSKWATIHRQKEVKDAKKGAIFTKLAGQIAIAVRQGGGIADPGQNFRLRLAMDKARRFNMPKENITRAIEKGMGAGSGTEVIEAEYEGFLPGGGAVVVEAVTDNKARTAQQVRSVLEKHGATLGGSGAVSHLFRQWGEIRMKVPAGGEKSVEETELAIIDLGVEDVERVGDELVILCDKEKTFEVKEKLEQLGWEVATAELVMRPQAWLEVKSDDQRQKIAAILALLEEVDEVTKVWTNYQMG